MAGNSNSGERENLVRCVFCGGVVPQVLALHQPDGWFCGRRQGCWERWERSIAGRRQEVAV